MILKIKNIKIDFFNKFSFSDKLDGVASVFGFDYYFDPENELHKELAHIGHYHNCSIEHEGETLLTGRLLSAGLKSSSETHLMKVGGYSLSGVLQDCTIPIEDYPLQSDGLSLREIAKKFTTRFGISVSISSSVSAKMDEVFEKTTASEGSMISQYLSSLASQKNILMTNTAQGGILFTRAKTKSTPIIDFKPGVPGVTYDLSFNGQAMHSEITVIKQTDIEGGNAGQSTVKNPFVPFTYRPLVKVQSSGTDTDTLLAAKTIRSNELKALKLTIVLDRWEDDSGRLIKKNNTITIVNKELSIFKKSTFFIESVNFLEDEKGRKSTLNCFVPSVYDGSEPIYIFEEG